MHVFKKDSIPVSAFRASIYQSVPVSLALFMLTLPACVSQPKPVQLPQAEEGPPPIAEKPKPPVESAPGKAAPSESTVVPPVPLPAPSIAETPRSTKDDIPVVEARSVLVTAERGAYAATRATTATKTDTPIMETPVSVQVVPRVVMDDQQVIMVGDALKNVSGVQPGGYTFYDNFILRGFDAGASTYRNGLRHIATTALETANPAAIERSKSCAARRRSTATVAPADSSTSSPNSRAKERPVFTPMYRAAPA